MIQACSEKLQLHVVERFDLQKETVRHQVGMDRAGDFI